MGDISIIARRLKSGEVQYGWSGNGGYFNTVGATLLEWYTSPEMVEYLFSLGEVMHLGIPHSEKGGASLMRTTLQTGRAHNIGNTERLIFSKIAFINYGYFYDKDNKWYYIIPGPFRVKIPLCLIGAHLDEQSYEFDFTEGIIRNILEYILVEWPKQDEGFRELLEVKNIEGDIIRKEVLAQSFPMEYFGEKYRELYQYFDDWIVVETNEACTEVTGYKLRIKAAEHKETVEW